MDIVYTNTIKKDTVNTKNPLPSDIAVQQTISLMI